MNMSFGVNLLPWRRVKRCIRCGKCCSSLDVPLTYEEEERLRKYGDVFRRGKIGVYLRKMVAASSLMGNVESTTKDLKLVKKLFTNTRVEKFTFILIEVAAE